MTCSKTKERSPEMQAKLEAFERLLTIMDELRTQCPWDKKQTMESLRHLSIEEVYELSDAILSGDTNEVKKELGDLMLHIVFYARIASETNTFDIGDVLHFIADKLVYRHPHIYGGVSAQDADTVKANWEKLKLKEQGRQSVLEGVPSSLPALVKAYRIQEKARGVGFDWERPEQVWDKVQEEVAEFGAEAQQAHNKAKTEAEFGDLLFALINYGRFLDINPEDALEQTNRKFIRRFQHLEKGAKAAGKSIDEMSLAEMDVFWEAAKKEE